MLTDIIEIDPLQPDKKKIRQAANIIKGGGLLAFPTETVYGLGANGLDKNASKKIYSAKGRPGDNPLILHIADLNMLDVVAKGDCVRIEKLANAFWPGPLTLVLNKKEIVPKETTGGLDTVAVRMPSRTVARLIIKESGLPIAAPSANISGRPSPTRAKHVIEDFNGIIDGIVDDGPSNIGLESTILDITRNTPVILREGFITKQEIEMILAISLPEMIGAQNTDRPLAPGMKYKHYAPQGKLFIMRISTDENDDLINHKIKEEKNNGSRTAVIVKAQNIGRFQANKEYNIGSSDEEIMHNLYAILRTLDTDKIDVAYCEDFSGFNHAKAIMDRLSRASGGNYI